MNIQEYRTSLQPLRKLDVNIYVLDYDFNILNEISGVTLSGNISIDANADIRRTIDITMALENHNTEQLDSVTPFNYNNKYYIGDIVTFNDIHYQCVSVNSVGYVQYILPTDTYFWKQYTFSQNDLAQQYWTAGNPYWFDKYIKIKIGVQDIYSKEYIWSNMGVYLINNPTITYNATTNTLSFQAIDLMSKLTGMRNGYLEGITYQIEANNSIVNAMRTILNEQGFHNMVLNEPPVAKTPIDINIDIGQTAYDILTQLRDVNPNWEMFFDENGVFRFQQIPSGNEISMFDNTVWDKVDTSSEISTNFEDIKNYIEVVGKQVDPNETAEATYTNNSIIVTLSRPFNSYYSMDKDIDVTWYIGFSIGAMTNPPIEFTTPISTITVRDSTGATQTITIPSSQEAKIYYNNETYFIRLVFSRTRYVTGEFGGYLQPRSIAFESNKESPFYVGDAIEHVSKKNNLNVNFVTSDYSNFIDIIGNTVNGNVLSINLIPYIAMREFQQASNGTQWAFKTHVNLDNGTKIDSIDIAYGGSQSLQFVTSNNENFLTNNNENFIVQELESRSVRSSIYKDNGLSWSELNTITLDYNGDYLIVLQKVNGSLKSFVSYYPLDASIWASPTTRIHSIPKFNKMVRGICSGDDYDNIYSNDLTNQRAKYELYLQCRLHDSINITCVPLYWLDVNTVMRFNYNSGTTNDDNLWIIKSISMDLSLSGTQSISAMKYYPLYNS